MRQQFKDMLVSKFQSKPERIVIEHIASELQIHPEFIQELANEIWPEKVSKSIENEKQQSDQITPFILVRLGEDLRPGAHLSPEFHICYSGWDGDVHVKSEIHGPLDREGWLLSPAIDLESAGYWIFHQSLSLTTNKVACPAGEYRVEFDIEFKNSAHAFDNRWRGWIRFRITDNHYQSGPTLEVESDGQSLVNLHGVNLKQFAAVKFKANSNSLVNLQSFLSALDDSANSHTGESSKPSMIPVNLRKVEERGIQIRRSIQSLRLDLPSGKKLLVFAKSSLMLGRNRPGSNHQEDTDIALRMMPRNGDTDALTGNISKQHLLLEAKNGKVTLNDPRRSDVRKVYPSTINQQSLDDQYRILQNNRPYRFETNLVPSSNGSKKGIGLDITVFEDSETAEQIKPALHKLNENLSNSTIWLRDQTLIDAVLIERTTNADLINGKEAYLMLTGIALMGSGSQCAIRLAGGGIHDEHALLCHWKGQFRLYPLQKGSVIYDGKPVPAGQIISLEIGKDFVLGQQVISIAKPDQIGM